MDVFNMFNLTLDTTAGASLFFLLQESTPIIKTITNNADNLIFIWYITVYTQFCYWVEQKSPAYAPDSGFGFII